MSVITGTNSWDASPVESTAPARRRSVQENAGDAPQDAFAASLAAMLHPRDVPAPKQDKDAAPVSELDAKVNGVAGESGSAGSPAPASAAAASAAAASAGAPNSKGAMVSEARPGTATATTTDVNSDADALNPDFRARLGRVVTRMHDEYGHDAEIVEGFRPQNRQEFLYEQGRTRPGDVVTWTKSSKHTLGLAADVKIDGSYDNTVAYRHLAQIAAQEGLRTLGARDPGHIELPTRGGAAAWGSVADTTRMNDSVSRAVGLALANGNAAAPDATEPGGDAHALNGFLSRMSHAGAAPATVSQQSGNAGGGASNGFGHQQRRSTEGKASEPSAITTAASAQTAHVADVAQIAHVADLAQVAQPGASSAPVGGAHMVAQSDAAERVGRMLDVRDATPAQPLSHVTLDLDNASGGTDRITVQLRAGGGAVDTAISLGDTNRADRMSLRVGELQHALEHHGLEASSIRVASTATDSGAGWTPRRGSDQEAHKEQPSPNYRDNRQDADEARQRARREQQGGKQK